VIYSNAWAMPWDVAAGSLIAEEAGAVVKNLKSDTYEVNNLDLVAASPKVYQQLKSLKFV
jgi:myo-inositol-1(or 4)-monophosphatase